MQCQVEGEQARSLGFRLPDTLAQVHPPSIVTEEQDCPARVGSSVHRPSGPVPSPTQTTVQCHPVAYPLASVCQEVVPRVLITRNLQVPACSCVSPAPAISPVFGIHGVEAVGPL